MDITKDIRPLTEFKRNTTEVMSHLKETGRPSILTVNGKPALVVMDAQAWQDAQDEIEYARTVADIRKGLDQSRDGKGVEAGAFFESLSSDRK
ncbi:MAG: type II toxin-antitoxin system Phd/YefM family antitoxin [Rhodospirillaceae bacterium]|jgi:prevent-host-death family protein|nr:type II toxin-antitoxin system Phd/YefM family antitoxin [Rhodospirillaceae bacterium]MBT5664896.1 type II toxin-antitoxin system Phd/YefM family antitoxin [Rhodospirillaceae bacterium]MBT5810329.1 type II toxin-antitoxin system Phd/YefM family antitoxin [Rhodospirillaceae bacterium]